MGGTIKKMTSPRSKDAKPQLAEAKPKAKEYDCIVIGGGIGGLTAAAKLALMGKSVVLVEKKNRLPSGCMSLYVSPKGDAEWPLGVHFVGGQVMNTQSGFGQLVNETTGGKVTFTKMPPHVIMRPDKSRQPFPDKWSTLVMALEHQFKDSAADIEAFDKYLHECFELEMKRLNFAEAPPTYSTETYAESLDKFNIKHPLLREALSVQCAIAALTAQAASTALLSFSAEYYREDTAFPVGGPAAWANAIKDTVTANKGEIKLGASVSKVIVEGGKTAGVTLADGSVLRGKTVVSCIGAHTTYCELVDPVIPALQEARDSLLANNPPMSTSAFMLCVTLKPGEYPKEFFFHMEPMKPPVYVSFMSARDPTWKDRYPDVMSCEITTRQVAEEWIGLAPEAVEAKVQAVMAYLLGVFELHFPEAHANIVDKYPLSPLKMQEELGSFHGSMYGVAQVPARVNKPFLMVTTALEGLYLGGQDMFCPNLYGASLGGVAAANAAAAKLG